MRATVAERYTLTKGLSLLSERSVGGGLGGVGMLIASVPDYFEGIHINAAPSCSDRKAI